MNLPSFEQLHQQADRRVKPVAVSVAGGGDRTVLEALRIATDRGWVAPIVVGDPGIAEDLGIDLAGFRWISAESMADQAVLAVREVREGRASILVKGQIATPALMDAVLDPEHGLRLGRVVSQVVLIEIIPQSRRFLMADTGINIKPKLATKIEIVRHVIDVARLLGVGRPRLALMAASESVNPAMPETIDALEIQRRANDGEFADAWIQGPLSFDLAYSTDAGGKKRIDGEVVGLANALVFPRPPLGQPDGEGHHVHRGLPVWRGAPRHLRPGRVHVEGRYSGDPPELVEPGIGVGD